MKHYVQLKDSVGFATISSDKDILVSESVIEVSGNPEQYLNKKYNGTDFVAAELIRYAIVDSSKTIVDIKKTYFSSDVDNNNGILIDNPEVQILWQWNGKHNSEKVFLPPSN